MSIAKGLVASLATLAMVDSASTQGVAQTAVVLPSTVKAEVRSSWVFDKSTGLYVYTFSLVNFGDSPLLAHEFHVSLRGANVVSMSAPPGWESSVNRAGSMAGWCACSESGFTVPLDPLDAARGTTSKYALSPGKTLSGFSLTSAYPPSSGTYYVGGWTPVPVEGVDFPVDGDIFEPDFPMNLRAGNTVLPERNDLLTLGGRRPAVDGFLVFANLNDFDTLTAPATVDLLLSQNGETVRPETMRVSLNGTDVTTRLKPIDVQRYRGVFQLGDGSGLKLGRNVLTTRIDGVVPSSGKLATDNDRVTFIVR